jgi:rhamnulokinase
MPRDSAFVAIDLGAESGRVIVGTLDGEQVMLEQMHRFANAPVRTPDGLHWDVLRIYTEAIDGLRAAARKFGDRIRSIGVDSWGVDYGLIDAGGRLLSAPYHYRDARTDGIDAEVAQQVPPAEQYARTGIAQLSINTLYQLAAQRRTQDGTLDLARSLLMIPDLFHYWLTGLRAAEHTIASTSGALDVDGRWAADILARLDLPVDVFLNVSSPGTVLGDLRAAVRDECGLGSARVILPAGHDTACAVAAVPSQRGGNHAYISSGTWSLLGLELDHPILSEDARLAGFTNERGVGLKPAGRAGTYRFLVNIMGLWLVQECRRSWARQGREWSYEELTAQAAATPSPGLLIDVDDPAFLHPDDMPAAIAAQLERTGQDPTIREPATVRAVLEGLALSYRLALERAERLSGMGVETIHVVGGGSRNGLLCQLTADACRRLVLAGPVEATALGNILVQAMGLGEISDLAEVHGVARSSADLTAYEPRPDIGWEERAARLQELRARTTDARAAS